MLIDRMDTAVLQAVMEALPLEVTVIDANDEVVGWNKHERRLFHRPLSSMGLNFRQCHPESSLPMVEKIPLSGMKAVKVPLPTWKDKQDKMN
jgi:hypothetical protein